MPALREGGRDGSLAFADIRISAVKGFRTRRILTDRSRERERDPDLSFLAGVVAQRVSSGAP